MKRQKDDAYFISRIIDDIDYILSILEGVDLDTFSSNQMMSDSTVFRLKLFCIQFPSESASDVCVCGTFYCRRRGDYQGG